MNQNILLFGLLIILITGCEKEICLNCHDYKLEEVDNWILSNGQIENFEHTFRVCEHDGMWDDILWFENTAGGSGSLIDLDNYIIGLDGNNENTDVDADGILNQFDDDIDNDGVLNFEDNTPYGLQSTTELKLIVCVRP